VADPGTRPAARPVASVFQRMAYRSGLGRERPDLQGRQQTKEHAGKNRRQQRENKGVSVQSHAGEQRNVECVQMSDRPRAGHRENQARHRAAAGERDALRKHLPQQTETPRA